MTMMMMNKFVISLLILICFSFTISAQQKSLDEAQTEIKTFANSQNFSVNYNQTKYVTEAEVKFDVVEPKTPFAKEFKEFIFKLTTLFATDGIDTKPVRTSLCINTYGKKFHFAGERNLTLTFDNETINLGEGNRSTNVKGKKIRENLCWEIDREIIDLLGQTAKLTYKINTVKGNLGSQPLQLFKDYAQLTKVNKK